jgi:hypothetical protein
MPMAMGVKYEESYGQEIKKKKGKVGWRIVRIFTAGWT